MLLMLFSAATGLKVMLFLRILPPKSSVGSCIFILQPNINTIDYNKSKIGSAKQSWLEAQVRPSFCNTAQATTRQMHSTTCEARWGRESPNALHCI